MSTVKLEKKIEKEIEDNKVTKEKIEILTERVEFLTERIAYLSGLIEKLYMKMGGHIDFVESVYSNVRHPVESMLSYFKRGSTLPEIQNIAEESV